MHTAVLLPWVHALEPTGPEHNLHAFAFDNRPVLTTTLLFRSGSLLRLGGCGTKVAAAEAPVTEADVLDVQSKWANAIETISKVHKEGGDYIQAAGEAAGELYAYGHSSVLFKPTKAAQCQFRPTAEDAMSYFVGGSVVPNGHAEDGTPASRSTAARAGPTASTTTTRS